MFYKNQIKKISMSRKLFEDAYKKYWDVLEQKEGKCTPYSYDIVSEVNAHKFAADYEGFAISIGLQESISWFNSWLITLADLEAWRIVLRNEYNEQEKWALRHHFVDRLAYFSLLQPSSNRERICVMATNFACRAHAKFFPEKKETPLSNSLKNKGNMLKRSDKERQLLGLVENWAYGRALVDALQKIDGESYREATNQYRNKASHYIPPRIEFGDLPIVSRQVISIVEEDPISEEDRISRDFFEKQGVTKVVDYSYEVVHPIKLDAVIALGREQIGFVQEALDASQAFIKEVLLLLDR